MRRCTYSPTPPAWYICPPWLSAIVQARILSLCIYIGTFPLERRIERAVTGGNDCRSEVCGSTAQNQVSLLWKRDDEGEQGKDMVNTPGSKRYTGKCHQQQRTTSSQIAKLSTQSMHSNSPVVEKFKAAVNKGGRRAVGRRLRGPSRNGPTSQPENHKSLMSRKAISEKHREQNFPESGNMCGFLGMRGLGGCSPMLAR